MGLLTDALGFLGVATWRYYLFFYAGTWVRRHFGWFLRWTDNPAVISSVAIGFIAAALAPHSGSVGVAWLIFALGGLCGLTLLFTLFRRLSSLVARLSLLTFTGTRTLDIYLLHYFFLPRFLLPYGEQLRGLQCQAAECLVALAVALVVVMACLAVSHVIRLSPFLGHWLFGAR